MCSYIDFFQKVLHDFEVKSHISSIKGIELSVKFKLFKWCHDMFTVLCLSLDWKIHFNFDFVLKSFRCSKRDVSHVLLKIVKNCGRKKLGDGVTYNWHKVEDMENELDCDSNNYFYLFSIFIVRSFKLHVSKHLHCFLQMHDDTFNLLGIQSGGCTLKFFCNFRSGSVDKVSLGTFSSQNHTPL